MLSFLISIGKTVSFIVDRGQSNEPHNRRGSEASITRSRAGLDSGDHSGARVENNEDVVQHVNDRDVEKDAVTAAPGVAEKDKEEAERVEQDTSIGRTFWVDSVDEPSQ
jgi:hypothetical protein